jgi:signal transduction histidine kinase
MAQPVRFVWQTDEEGRFTLASAEFMSLVGEQTATLLGQPWCEIAAKLGLDPDGQIAQALATQDTWSALTVAWPTGKKDHSLVVELSGLPVFDRERSFRGYRGFGICRDAPPIAAALVEESSDRAAPARLSETRELATGTHNAQHNVLMLRSSEAVGTAAPTLSPAEHAAFQEISRKLGRGLRRRSGEHALHSAIVRDEMTEIAAELNAGLMEKAPAERTSNIRGILDRMPMGILIYRLSQIFYANPTFLSWSGHNNVDGLIEAGGLDELFIEPLAAAIQTEADAALRVKLTGRAKSSIECELFNIVWEGEPAHALLAEVATDTNRLNDQSENRAEISASPTSAFIAHVSHELRTPLNSIIGFAELMIEERLGALGNPRYREYLKDIHASGTHLLSLVNDLLDMSKLEAGKFTLTPAPVDLNKIVSQCVALMQPQAQRSRVVIRSSPSASLPRISADVRSIRQMLFNLLANSVKFTPVCGQVIVSTSLNEPFHAVLRVRDTGKGMSADELRATMDAGRHWNGAPGLNGGFGLLLTRALAEANGATFHMTSPPGAGTLVEIAFPAIVGRE